jgi:hypothetical protein
MVLVVVFLTGMVVFLTGMVVFVKGESRNVFE